MKFRRIISNSLGWAYHPIFKFYRKKKKIKNIRYQTSEFINTIKNADKDKPKVFYLGITNHSNLGDLAQHYCINCWIDENYPNYEIIKVEADTLVYEGFNFMSLFKDAYSDNDIIIFQSGYTTQDLGGCHELMHRMVIDNIPNANILMMPQTIYFREEKNRERTSISYNKARKMLFLARDMVSYNQAIQMFPDVTVKAFPDIVTSLIGKYHFKKDREGICLCVRNDGEKLYSENEISILKKELSKTTKVTQTDTTINVPFMKIRNNLKEFIDKEIEAFSTYEIVVTDRYHGTIFALAAGTPVIILKTNDHKVITGADWFKGVYDDYVYLAEDLNDVHNLIAKIRSLQLEHTMSPHFNEKFYKNLKKIFCDSLR